jgi:type IV pilus assembly protein PilK
VLVYFRRWRRHQALNFLAGRLKPGGLLIIGPGEGSDWRPEQLLRVRTTDVAAYRRPGSREDRGDR